MMRFFYSAGIHLYKYLIWIVSFKNPKAKKWLEGRSGLFERMRESLNSKERRLWFHASSLGEFEQGMPVIESIKSKFPEYKIVLTFYSPSGYDLKKDYPYADYVFYLPVDTRSNARKFLDIVKPEKVFFIKYEFWFNFLLELKKREIPTYIFSALFRPSQLFFKPWGGWFRKALHAYTHFFVQNQESYDILNNFGFHNVTINGDTRLDRVNQIAIGATKLPLIEQFCNGEKVIVAGSTWKEDEELFLNYVNECTHKVKFVIASHEVNHQSTQRIISILKRPYVCYSANSTPEELKNATVVIADGYGYLVSIYKYAKIAYVGGGFTNGIHSTLEPAAYGMPVIFGPNYLKFKEATEMISLGAAHSISTYDELKNLFDDFLTDESILKKESRIALEYVKQNRGATDLIVNEIFLN